MSICVWIKEKTLKLLCEIKTIMPQWYVEPKDKSTCRTQAKEY